ncbi:unnamed protein product [Caenorhabditis sp. 36 PRJEB53466]|nr:unnamed protein product [Caenorhabditis sp. 36 PRJEB53466]
MFVDDRWPVYQEYLRYIWGAPFDRFHKEGLDVDLDGDVDSYNTREIVVFRACLIGYEPCIKMSMELFGQLRRNCSGTDQLLSGIDCNTIPLYLRQHVYSAAIAHGTQEDFDFLLEKYTKEHYLLERDRIFHGMCGTDSRENSAKMWLYLVENPARENFFTRAVACSKKLTRKTLMMDFFVKRPSLLAEVRTKLGNKLNALLLLAHRQIYTREQCDQFDKMVEPLGEYGRSAGQLRYQTLARIEWREAVAAHIAGNASEALAEMKKLQF